MIILWFLKGSLSPKNHEIMKKKTGGDNPKSLPAGRKRSDNSTSYDKPKIHNVSKMATGPKNATVMVSRNQMKKK